MSTAWLAFLPADTDRLTNHTRENTMYTDSPIIDRLAVRAALGHGPSADALDTLRIAELRTLDPSAFEGDAESGPHTPLTTVDHARRAAITAWNHARLDLALEALAVAAGDDAVDDDDLFIAAATCGLSPAYALDVAYRIGATDESPTRERRARISARMDREHQQRCAARDAAGVSS